MKYQNIIKTEEEYKSIKNAAQISVRILKQIINKSIKGADAGDLNDLVGELCSSEGVKPAFLGVPGTYTPFPSNICISVNNEVMHSIPHKGKIFKEGDLVKLDFGVISEEFYTDHCVTIPIGEVSQEDTRLMNTGRLCIDTAVQKAIVGNKVSDISESLQTVAELGGYNYVTSYCGHGIWKSLWQPPEIPSYKRKRDNIDLVEGMVLCVENQITKGSTELELDEDGWTLLTEDNNNAVMFEHMVIVRNNKPEILTLLN